MIEAARSMLHHAKLPLEFWAEAVQVAVYIRNRSPTVALNNKTPYECWFNRKPDVSNLRVFGSECYVHIPDNFRQKLDAKSYKGIFVGYPEGTKGYKIYNLDTNKFTKTRHVVFNENVFHDFKKSTPKKEEIISVVLPIETDIVDRIANDEVMQEFHDVSVLSPHLNVNNDNRNDNNIDE